VVSYSLSMPYRMQGFSFARFALTLLIWGALVIGMQRPEPEIRFMCGCIFAACCLVISGWYVVAYARDPEAWRRW